MAIDKLSSDIQSLSPSAIIELFVLDYTNLKYPGVFRFYAGKTELGTDIVWQGETYKAMPIEASGFDVTTKGTLPKPKIKLLNMGGLFSAEIAVNGDLVGAKVIRKRTFARFLDAVNFPGGVNPDADPNQHYPDDIWFVEQKINETRYIIEWDLSSPFDLNGVMLPGRQIIQNSCPWKYKGPECGYDGSGGYYTSLDETTPYVSLDVCSKRLSGCKLRRTGFPDGILPFGGFPGANRYD